MLGFKRVTMSLAIFFMAGCTTLVESINENNHEDSVAIAKDMDISDINKKDETSRVYPLIFTIKKHKLDIAKILIGKGANLNIKANNGEYILDLVLKDDNIPDQFIMYLLKKGASKVSDNTLQYLLNKHHFKRLTYLFNSNVRYKESLKSIILSKPENYSEMSYINFLSKNKVLTKTRFFKYLALEKEFYLISKYPEFKKDEFFNIILVKILNTKNIEYLSKYLEQDYPVDKDDFKKILSFVLESSDSKSEEIINLLISHYINNSKSKNKEFAKIFLEKTLNSKNIKYLSKYLEQHYPINGNDFKKILLFIGEYSDTKIKKNVDLMIKNYPNFKEEIFIYLLNRKDNALLLFNGSFSLNNRLVCKAEKLDLNYHKIEFLLENSKNLKKRSCYKKLMVKANKQKVYNKWEEFKSLLNKRDKKLIDKIVYDLDFLKNNKYDKLLREKARNMQMFFDQLNNEKVSKKELRKLIGLESVITDDAFQKSGPCLFGMCAGYNHAKAIVKVRVIDILDDGYVKCKVIGVKVKRLSVSDWNVYNNVVRYLKNKYREGDIITRNSLTDVINDTMWNIHKTKNRKGFSKKFLARIGVYMSDAKATSSARDTGNWLVYDYMGCDAGIFANRVNNIFINDSVFNKTYEKMKKNCARW